MHHHDSLQRAVLRQAKDICKIMKCSTQAKHATTHHTHICKYMQYDCAYTRYMYLYLGSLICCSTMRWFDMSALCKPWAKVDNIWCTTCNMHVTNYLLLECGVAWGVHALQNIHNIIVRLGRGKCAPRKNRWRFCTDQDWERPLPHANKPAWMEKTPSDMHRARDTLQFRDSTNVNITRASSECMGEAHISQISQLQHLRFTWFSYLPMCLY